MTITCSTSIQTYLISFFILDKLISNLTLGKTSVHLIVLFTDLFFDDKESKRLHAPSLFLVCLFAAKGNIDGVTLILSKSELRP